VLRRWCALAAIALAGVLLVAGCGPTTGGTVDKPSPTETLKAGAPTSSAPAPAVSVSATPERSGSPPISAPPTDPPKPGAAAPNNSPKDDPWTKKVGDLLVSLKITPYPPQGRNPTNLDIAVADSAGFPVSDAQVRLNLTMPAMPMPPNQPNAQAAGNGHYTASTRMGMPGQWQIAVLITRNGQQQRADFFAEVP
jgi:hypothetical protein